MSVQVSTVVLVQKMTVFWVLYRILCFVASKCRNEALYTWLYVDSCTFGWLSYLCTAESVSKPPNVSSTPALCGGERSASRLGWYTTGEAALRIHLIGWLGPRAGLDTVVERKISNPDILSAHSVVLTWTALYKCSQFYFFTVFPSDFWRSVSWTVPSGGRCAWNVFLAVYKHTRQS
jgi:hypothetical protein